MTTQIITPPPNVLSVNSTYVFTFTADLEFKSQPLSTDKRTVTKVLFITQQHIFAQVVGPISSC